MTIVQRQLDDVAVLELTGNLDCGTEERDLVEVIDDLAKRGCVRVVLNLKEVSHIDTTCLGLLIAAHMGFRRRRGGVNLLQTPPRIRHVLSIARLDQVLLTFETEEDALRAFAESVGI
jgi:anti-anti-sigma factor